MKYASQFSIRTNLPSLNDLLESTVDGGPDVRHVLPEINGGDGTLGDTLGGEFKLLFLTVSLCLKRNQKNNWLKGRES